MPEPGTDKTTFDVKVSVCARTDNGILTLDEVPYRGTKTVYESLEQYGMVFSSEAQIVSLAINNKNSSVLSVYVPVSDATQEFSLQCQEK